MNRRQRGICVVVKKLYIYTVTMKAGILMSDNNEYVCRYTPKRIRIEGRLDDPAWQSAENIRFYIPETLADPVSQTEARILWDDNYLYVGFKAYDKDIWSYLTDQDSQTCTEDCLEFFFKPYENIDSYYNFEINALGTVYDALNLKRGAGSHRWARWDCENLKLAVTINGEINNPDIIDDYWQLEIAVPFASLPTLKGAVPQHGDVWMFHLARYDYSIHLPNGVELSSCAPLSRADFHLYEEWIPLRFEK